MLDPDLLTCRWTLSLGIFPGHNSPGPVSHKLSRPCFPGTSRALLALPALPVHRALLKFPDSEEENLLSVGIFLWANQAWRDGAGRCAELVVLGFPVSECLGSAQCHQSTFVLPLATQEILAQLCDPRLWATLTLVLDSLIIGAHSAPAHGAYLEAAVDGTLETVCLAEERD